MRGEWGEGAGQRGSREQPPGAPVGQAAESAGPVGDRRPEGWSGARSAPTSAPTYCRHRAAAAAAAASPAAGATATRGFAGPQAGLRLRPRPGRPSFPFCKLPVCVLPARRRAARTPSRRWRPRRLPPGELPGVARGSALNPASGLLQPAASPPWSRQCLSLPRGAPRAQLLRTQKSSPARP